VHDGLSVLRFHQRNPEPFAIFALDAPRPWLPNN
jgi:hypothetical protein